VARRVFYFSWLFAANIITPMGTFALGGTVKLAGPQGGLAFDREGTDSGQLSIPPSPTVAGSKRAGEMVEDYWMALARDVTFSQFGERD
jgi:hypothetical protein